MILAALLALAASSSDRGSPAAARAVVQRYYAAIDRGEYRTAYRCWDHAGADSRQSYAQFVRGFARTRHVAAAVGAPTDGEGAAGSVYLTVPVDVRARLKSGGAQHFTGRYVLRRVNDVDGATAEQLTWHLTSATLRPVG